MCPPPGLPAFLSLTGAAFVAQQPKLWRCGCQKVKENQRQVPQIQAVPAKFPSALQNFA
jgi:hypothetical protein